MRDSIPVIRYADIQRIIKRDFSDFSFDDIEALLQKYNTETEQGRNRIYASILKLANGDMEQLIKYVEIANKDYRDVLAWAEYPGYFEVGFEDVTDAEAKRLNNEDWNQYQTWFNKK